jgi:hypothetical protein
MVGDNIYCKLAVTKEHSLKIFSETTEVLEPKYLHVHRMALYLFSVVVFFFFLSLIFPQLMYIAYNFNLYIKGTFLDSLE